jgi:hypothetical protein
MWIVFYKGTVLMYAHVGYATRLRYAILRWSYFKATLACIHVIATTARP